MRLLCSTIRLECHVGHANSVTGWSKKRQDDGTDDGTPGGRYAMGHCPVVVYVRRTHYGTLARGVVQAMGNDGTRLIARRYLDHKFVITSLIYRNSVHIEKKVAYAKYANVR